MCLDCSASHRSLGVHTTFVRSVDLDEWTQRQIDAMRLGGNANARQFFRQHGLTDMHGKIEKKYTSKAAIAYRNELSKLVEAEACKRGEGNPEAAAASTGSLLENLEFQQAEEFQAEAKAKLAAARAANATASALQPKAQLASERDGAKGKLVVTPPNSGGLVLRKPASKASSAMMLKKKPSGGLSTKLRVNKLSSQTSSGSDAQASDDVFDSANAEPEDEGKGEAKQIDEGEVAQALLQLNLSENVAQAMAAPEPVVPESPSKKTSVLEQGVSRLKAMNTDFFSGV